MSGRSLISLSELRSRVFAERRIYVRTVSGTTYWTVSPMSQAGVLFLVIAMLGWSVFTSVAFIDAALDQRSAERRLETAKETHKIQLAALSDQQRLLEEELNRSNARGDRVTATLSTKQRVLVETATKLQAAQIELDGLRQSYTALVAERRRDVERLNALNEELTSLRIATAESAKDDELHAETMQTLSSTMEDIIAARDQARARANVLDERVAALENSVTEWEHRQESLLAQLEDATRTSLSSLDSVFVGSGVDLESILRRTRRDYTGRGGGPLEESDEAEVEDVEPADGERVAALMTDLERMSLMRIAVNRLPFGMPTRGAERTSGFGIRRDPYRRSTRMHNGVDFAAPRGTPIYSTAEGVVVFSGRKRGYGITVKIRHAFGFETVYAHLSKSRVEVGQRVKRGDRIADMGSTGRSTGSHLHYEVRIDGKPVNPSKFIRAARNVL